MSERKIKYQFSPFPVEWLINPKLSATEKVVLCVLIALGNDSGISCSGYKKLAEDCCLNRTYLIQVINKLESMGFIERFVDTGRNHASKIRVRYEILGGVYHTGEKESFYLDSFSQKKESDFKSERVCFDEKKSLSQPTQTIFKQDLNYNKGKSLFEQTIKKQTFEQNNYIATPDVAGVRSMPCGEQVAANDLAKDELDEVKAAKIQAKVQAIRSYFGQQMNWIEVFEVSNKICFRVCDMTLDKHLSGIDIEAAKGFAALHDVIFTNKHFANERKIA